MTSLYILAEGDTEREFATKTLQPHLWEYGISAEAMRLTSNRQLGARGGILKFSLF